MPLGPRGPSKCLIKNDAYFNEPDGEECQILVLEEQKPRSSDSLTSEFLSRCNDLRNMLL